MLGIIRLSRASHRKVIQNLVWATGYNAFAIPLAARVLAWAGITLAPAVGAILMSVSTIIVAAHAQLLRRLDLRQQARPDGPNMEGNARPVQRPPSLHYDPLRFAQSFRTGDRFGIRQVTFRAAVLIREERIENECPDGAPLRALSSPMSLATRGPSR